MLKKFGDFVNESYTAYQAVDNVKAILDDNGFIGLREGEKWQIAPNSGYYVVRDGSSIIAFKTGKEIGDAFNIVACHTDSPCLKLKNNCVVYGDGYAKLNVETYGGGLLYSMLDRPLKIAGRVVVKEGDVLKCVSVVSDFYVTIPSVAIHQNRNANDGLTLNPQIDMMPVIGLGNANQPVDIVSAVSGGKQVVDFDLYVVSATQAYRYGVNGEFFAAPRLDDLTGVFGGITSLINCNPVSLAVCACFDNEEVGSGTKQGAGGTFLKDVLKTLYESIGRDKIAFKKAVLNSFMASMDNAHAVHPNHAEKYDATNKCFVNKGIVIKHHANQSYLTDCLSSAVFKQILDNAEVPHQDFFNRSDSRGGSTLGTISNRQLSVRTVDIGLAQLAMHSFCECMGSQDIDNLTKGLKAFYQVKLESDAPDSIKIK